MKQLFLQGKATTTFFLESVSNEDICKWIENQVHMGNNLFSLNEIHSCSVKLHTDNHIVIQGDEDWKDIIIETITPINLFV